MKHTFSCFFLAALLTLAPACQHINSDTGQAILKIGLRLATYEIVKKNPDLEPILSGFVSTVQGIDRFLLPESVDAQLAQYIDSEISHPMHRQSAGEVSRLLVDYYQTIYSANKDRLTDTEYRRILDKLTEAIQAGLLGLPGANNVLESYPAGVLILEFQ